MALGISTTIVGVFESRERAQEAVAALKNAGFDDHQIGVAARHDSSPTLAAAPGHTRPTVAPATDDDTYAAEGAATGAVAGAGVGGLWALGIAAGALPAIGPVVAGGILASLVASAAAGAAAGGLGGALLGLGLPKEEADYYDSEFRSGRTIVTVRSEERQNEALSILQRFGAYDAHTSAARI